MPSNPKQPSATPAPHASEGHPSRCTAKTRSGAQCRSYAIQGATVCRMHGGNAPQVKAAAKRKLERQAAEVKVARLGLPRAIDAHAALLEELHRTAGLVAWLGQQVSALERDELTWGTVRQTHGAHQDEGEQSKVVKQAGVHVLVKLWQEERGNLVKVARACIDVGIEERRVRLEEAAGQQLASVVRAVLDRMLAAVLAAVLEVLPDDEVRQVFRRAFEAAWAQSALVIVPEEFRRLGEAQDGAS